LPGRSNNFAFFSTPVVQPTDLITELIGTVKAGERAASHERSGNDFNLVSECAARLYELSAVGLPAPGTLVDQLRQLADAYGLSAVAMTLD
jgi:hypothetical protein